MTLIAKVRIASPLPALDKEFDYLVPDNIAELGFGQLVRVPFGPDKKQKVGVVVGTSDHSSFKGSLAEIIDVDSHFPLLSFNQFALIEAVASRFMGSIGELLSAVIPKRMVRVEKTHLYDPEFSEGHKGKPEPKREYVQPSITRKQSYPNWSKIFAEKARDYITDNRSVIVSLPDYRDIDNLKIAFAKLGLVEDIHIFSSANSASQNYANYLQAMQSTGIFVGLRSSIFLPAPNLGLILVLDDGDESQIEPSSPYWNTRDVALLRQSLENCDLLFSSLSPSAEVVRLVEIGYLKHVSDQSQRPAVRITESLNRLDEATYSAIAKSLKQNSSVLIQIANLGFATALACVKCSDLRKCGCGARIWIDTKKKFRCRSCKATGDLPPCQCGETRVRTLRTGSSAMVEWLKKAFTEANVIHSSAEERITRIEPGPNLVIATPGSEPEVSGGYTYVVLADAYSMVGAPRLRALEKSLLLWANAIEKASETGVVIFSGLTDQLAESMKDLQFFEAMRQDFLEREELGLPPTRRIASVESNSSSDLELLKVELIQALGPSISPIASAEPKTIHFCFNYSEAENITPLFRELVARISSKSKNRLPGQRLFRVRMDDPNAI